MSEINKTIDCDTDCSNKWTKCLKSGIKGGGKSFNVKPCREKEAECLQVCKEDGVPEDVLKCYSRCTSTYKKCKKIGADSDDCPFEYMYCRSSCEKDPVGLDLM